jgi:hypothetical protein
MPAMRSIGPWLLALTGLACIGLVLVLVQSVGLRGDLDATRAELAELRAEVDSMERGVPMAELSMRLGELENEIQDWVLSFGGTDGDGTDGGGTDMSTAALLDRLDEVLDEIRALNRRVDDICEGVPVC